MPYKRKRHAKRGKEQVFTSFTMMKTGGFEAMAYVRKTPAWISKEVERFRLIFVEKPSLPSTPCRYNRDWDMPRWSHVDDGLFAGW